MSETLTVEQARQALGESLNECCIASFCGKGWEQRSAEYIAAVEALIAAVRAEEQAQREALVTALEWLTNIYCGVSKGGGRPDEGEWIDCIESAKAALAGETK